MIVMLGRDIEIINPRKITSSVSKQKIYYLNELAYNGLAEQNEVRPASELKIGMDKIQTRGWFTRYLVDYANTAMFHGLNHIVAPNRSIWERIAALIILIISMILLIALSWSLWEFYQTDAIITVVNHDYRRYKVELPSILICPDAGVDRTKFPTVLEKYGLNNTKKVRDFFIIASRAFDFHGQIPDIDVNPSDIISILYDLKPDITHSANEEPQWVITPKGICLEFFNAASEFSTIEYLKNNGSPMVDDYLFDNVRYCKYDDPNCTTVFNITGSKSFQLGITPFADIPNWDMFYTVSSGSSITIEIYPDITITTDNVMELNEEQRGCKSWKQNGLLTWPIYTKNRCQLECLTLKLSTRCNCVYHFLRPIAGLPTCNLKIHKCYKIRYPSDIGRAVSAVKNCPCPNDCFLTTYRITDIDIVKRRELSNRTQITVDMIFPKRKFYRKLDFTLLDFLAAVGGGAGLLLGASFLSFIELFYIFTLKLYLHYSNIKRIERKKLQIIRLIMRNKNEKMYFQNSL